MKTFLAIFTCAENSKAHLAWKQLSSEQQQERLKKGPILKEQWLQKYKDQIVFDGGMLGEPTVLINNDGIKDIPSKMGAFLVIKADSQETAAKMFLDHPHFSCFPGDGVEILERTDIPRT